MIVRIKWYYFDYMMHDDEKEFDTVTEMCRWVDSEIPNRLTAWSEDDPEEDYKAEEFELAYIRVVRPEDDGDIDPDDLEAKCIAFYEHDSRSWTLFLPAAQW